MKIYVAESCGDEGGTVLGVAKSIKGCDKLIKKYQDEYCDDVEYEVSKETFDNIVKLYTYAESEEPAFAIREFEALE